MINILYIPWLPCKTVMGSLCANNKAVSEAKVRKRGFNYGQGNKERESCWLRLNIDNSLHGMC